jgi:hypothetical protein
MESVHLEESPVHNEHERNEEEDRANVGTAVGLHRWEGVSQPSLANSHPKQGEEGQIECTEVCRRDLAEEGDPKDAVCRHYTVTKLAHHE